MRIRKLFLLIFLFALFGFILFSFIIETFSTKPTFDHPRTNIPNYRSIQPFTMNFKILNEEFCITESSFSMDLLLVIKSHPLHQRKRTVIRRMWQLQNWNELKVKKLFLIGRHDDINNEPVDIATESDFYMDIVQYDSLENIFNSTEKLLTGFDWVTTYCKNTRFVLIQSDEVLLSPSSVKNYLCHNYSTSMIRENIFGSLEEGNSDLKERRNNDETVLKLNRFVSCKLVCIISYHFIKKITIATQFVKYYELEKIFLTVVVQKLALPHIDITNQIKFTSTDLDNFISVSEQNLKVNKAEIKKLALSNSSDEFRYPLNINMPYLVERIRNGQPINLLPINSYFVHKYTIKNSRACEPFTEKINLLIVIKTVPSEFSRRQMIRQMWACPRCWLNWNVHHIFTMGHMYNESIDNKIYNEAIEYGDIIRQDFVDHYYNNTYKIMMSFNWVTHNCPNAEFIVFADSDVLLNPRNIMQRLTEVKSAKWFNSSTFYYGHQNFFVDVLRFSKWSVSREEISWDFYPSYLSGGLFFMTYDVVRAFNSAMPYVRYFRFDDVFLGIIAHKLNNDPIHGGNEILSLFRKYDERYDSFLGSHLFDKAPFKDIWRKLNYKMNCA